MATQKTPRKVRELEPLLRDGIRAFMRIAGTARLICEENGLALGQYRTLIIIAEEPLRARKLADRLQLTPQALTWSLDNLEEQKLITRRRDPDDGRAVQLRITPKGRRAIENVDLGLADLFLKLAPQDEVELVLKELTLTTPALDAETRRLSGEPEPGDDPNVTLLPNTTDDDIDPHHA